jgi:hypothetical protein
MTNVTKIADAFANRNMGRPLNAEIKDGGKLPASIVRVMERGWDSAIKFREAIHALIENPESRKLSDRMVRALYKFVKATDPERALKIKGETIHGHSFAFIAGASLYGEFGDIREQWMPWFEALEAGDPTTINYTDLEQMWPFVESAATKRRRSHPAF